MNEAIIRGVIVSLRGNAISGNMTIACPQTARSKKGSGATGTARTNYPALSYNSDTLTRNIIGNYKVGDHVIVKGYAQSYVRRNGASSNEVMNVYVREIMHDSSKFMNAFGTEGRTYPEPQNELYLSGKLAGITKRDGGVLVLRLDISEGRKNFVNLTMFRADDETAAMYKVGDTLNVLASVQTIDTSLKKDVPYYQSFVVADIAKAEQAD